MPEVIFVLIIVPPGGKEVREYYGRSIWTTSPRLCWTLPIIPRRTSPIRTYFATFTELASLVSYLSFQHARVPGSLVDARSSARTSCSSHKVDFDEVPSSQLRPRDDRRQTQPESHPIPISDGQGYQSYLRASRRWKFISPPIEEDCDSRQSKKLASTMECPTGGGMSQSYGLIIASFCRVGRGKGQIGGSTPVSFELKIQRAQEVENPREASGEIGLGRKYLV